MTGRWFRFYDGVAHDPKVQLLNPFLFRLWVNALCLCSANGGRLPPLHELIFTLRLGSHKLTGSIDHLVAIGLLERQEDGSLSPHNWKGRQFQSDVSTKRVQRFRKRKRNVSETASETAPDTDTDTDTEKEEENRYQRSSTLSPDPASASVANHELPRAALAAQDAVEEKPEPIDDGFAREIFDRMVIKLPPASPNGR